jgi:hypothetical protein
LLALFALLCCGQSRASANYDFSYTFDTGNVISGSFVGTPSSGLITNLTNIHASLDGAPLKGPLEAFLYTDAGVSPCLTNCFATGGVASFAALQNNFLFADASDPSLSGFTNYFYIIPWPNGASNPVATQYVNNNPGATVALIDNYNGQFIPNNWLLTYVPEPSMALLIVPAFMGIVGIRRKLAK